MNPFLFVLFALGVVQKLQFFALENRFMYSRFAKFGNRLVTRKKFLQTSVPGAVDAARDDLDRALDAGLAVDAAAADGVAAVAQDPLAHVQVVVQEERRFLGRNKKHVEFHQILH